jgi:hypothetical protein
MSEHGTITTGTARSTRRQLIAGAAAGPLFLTTWLAQAVTREGFDPSRHPISLLSLGDQGWIQVANFVVTGSLYVAGAVGLRRTLRRGRGRTWGPLLVGGFGVGLALAGVFVTDAGAGFPAGAPAGAPDHFSWHGVLHEVGFGLAQLSWAAATVVLARRFANQRRWGWTVACLAGLVGALTIVGWPDLNSFAVRSTVATAVEMGLLTAVFGRLLVRSAPAPASGTAGSENAEG